VHDPSVLAAEADRIAEILDGDDKAAHAKKKKPYRRGETMLEHLPRWLAVTTAGAKVIPVIIGVFVLLATLTIAISILQSRMATGATEHVTLRFLPVNEPTAPDNQYATPPTITIETEPAGVLIVLDRKILGPTPLTFESPYRGDRLGIEL